MRYHTTTDDRVPACGEWRSLARHERAGRYVFGIDVGVVDHDGEGEFDGGIARWLKLPDGLGLDRDYVTSLRGLLPGTRFAVDAYVHFLREKTLLEAIAAPSWSASRSGGAHGDALAKMSQKAQCPLWVISGHSAVQSPCPLYPRKRTFKPRATER
jgi:hypothetical protein